MTKDEILNEIDNLVIYEKDYPLIKSLIDTADDKFTVAVLEEVIKGNLLWSDFEQILSKTDYTNLISETIPLQNKLEKQVKAIIELRQSIDGTNINLAELTQKTGFVPETDNSLYESVEEEERYDILYSLLTYNSNDTPITQAIKTKLLNGIENWKYYNSLSDEDKKKYVIENGKIHEKNKTNSYIIINPHDILISASDYIVPINTDFIVLNKTDIAFMRKYNLTEDQVKQFKAITRFFININGGK